MINLSVSRVDPDKVEELRAWLAEAQNRADEVRATFVDEKVRHEKALLVEGSDGPVLVYVVECDDMAAAQAVFARSTHPIDIEHKAKMPALRGEDLPYETLLDILA